MIDIIFEDRDLLVVNKPSGLLCVPGLSSPDNLFDRVKSYNPNARTVHRLDMGTSGLVIFALNYDAQKAMGKLFENRQIKKQYSARVIGKLASQYGEINAPMLCDWPNRPKQKIDWLNGKQANTFYRVISKNAGSTLIELMPHTGRTHQLRLHMLNIGHPILGDEFYNLNGSEKKADRLLLHAEYLSFVHPIKQQKVNIKAMANFR